MQQIEDIGCLTQRSQLDRLRDLADTTTRQRIKTAEPTLATTIFVIGAGGKESTWDLDHLPLATTQVSLNDRLQLEAEEALANLVPTQVVMRILRDTRATAAALVSSVTTGAVALQLADTDHEQSLTARIDRPIAGEATLGKWDFGKVAWAVRLRYVLRAAQLVETEPRERLPLPEATATPAPVRASDSASARRNHRREMREQLHRQPAAAPSWIQ